MGIDSFVSLSSLLIVRGRAAVVLVCVGMEWLPSPVSASQSTLGSSVNSRCQVCTNGSGTEGSTKTQYSCGPKQLLCT